MVFSERDWSATAKDGGEKRREAKIGDSKHVSEPGHCHVSCGYMSVNLASWHTDGGLHRRLGLIPTKFLEELGVSQPVFSGWNSVHVFLKPRKYTPPMPAFDGSYRKGWQIWTRVAQF